MDNQTNARFHIAGRIFCHVNYKMFVNRLEVTISNIDNFDHKYMELLCHSGNKLPFLLSLVDGREYSGQLVISRVEWHRDAGRSTMLIIASISKNVEHSMQLTEAAALANIAKHKKKIKKAAKAYRYLSAIQALRGKADSKASLDRAEQLERAMK